MKGVIVVLIDCAVYKKPYYQCQIQISMYPLGSYSQERQQSNSYQDSTIILLGLYPVILLGLLRPNQLVSHPLEYIKEARGTQIGRTNSSLNQGNTTPKRRVQFTKPQIGRRVLCHWQSNLSKFVSCFLVFTFEFKIW